MYAHILIPTDGSELATRGLEHGLGLAKSLDAPVLIVTVTELWSPFDMAGETRRGVVNPIAVFEEAATESARKILDRALGLARERGVRAEGVHVPDSHAAEGIIRTAEERGCDLIVMASHGRRGVSRLLLGSQATEVLAETRVPVLIVR